MNQRGSDKRGCTVHEALDVELKDNIILKLPDVVISHKLVEIVSNGMSVTI